MEQFDLDLNCSETEFNTQLKQYIEQEFNVELNCSVSEFDTKLNKFYKQMYEYSIQKIIDIFRDKALHIYPPDDDDQSWTLIFNDNCMAIINLDGKCYFEKEGHILMISPSKFYAMLPPLQK